MVHNERSIEEFQAVHNNILEILRVSAHLAAAGTWCFVRIRQKLQASKSCVSYKSVQANCSYKGIKPMLQISLFCPSLCMSCSPRLQALAHYKCC